MPKDCLKDVIKERQEKRDKMVGGTVNSLKRKKSWTATLRLLQQVPC